MKNLERCQLKIKLELAKPSDSNLFPIRYSVNRTLKARWSNDPTNVTLQILEEIRKYNGSFIGDMVKSLGSLDAAEGGIIKQESARDNDVVRFAAAVLDALVFAGVRDKIHEELLSTKELSEWDGTVKEIDNLTQDELVNVDIEKVMILLAPRIKHALFLMSKSLQHEEKT